MEWSRRHRKDLDNEVVRQVPDFYHQEIRHAQKNRFF